MAKLCSSLNSCLVVSPVFLRLVYSHVSWNQQTYDIFEKAAFLIAWLFFKTSMFDITQQLSCWVDVLEFIRPLHAVDLVSRGKSWLVSLKKNAVLLLVNLESLSF